MSATLPVSFQYPEMTVEFTLWPVSISDWIASVISSSPRHGGREPAHRLVDGRGEHIHPDKSEVAFRLAGFLLEADYLPGGAELRDAELAWVGHLGQHDLRVRPGGTELPDQVGDSADDEVIAEVHDKVVVAEELTGDEYRMGEAERSGLPDVRDVEPERGAVADRRLDRRGGVSDDDADLGDVGVTDGLKAVEQHWFVGDGHELFGRGMRDRAQPGPRAAG